MNPQSKPKVGGETFADNPQADNVSQSAFENIEVEGNFTVGDISQTINQFWQESNDFVKRQNLEEYTFPCFPHVLDIDNFLAVLRNHRFLIIGGNHPDKLDLALHIAVKLTEMIASRRSEGYVLEFKDSSNAQSMLATIRGENTDKIKSSKNATNIFLLTDIKLQYKLGLIQKAAQTGESYVIATTDIPLNIWNDSQIRSVGRQISNENFLYQPQHLLDSLIARLEKKSYSQEVCSKVRQVVGNELETFTSTNYFIQSLSGQDSTELTHQEISKALHSAKQDREISLREWFNTLDAREKLLALSLSLFNGLFTDQFFAALEQVVSHVWQRRDASLRALDYEDLQKLRNYFEYEQVTVYDTSPKGFKYVKTADYPAETEISLINLKNLDDRSLLFKIAWDTHRRQIINALTEIVQMVKAAVAENAANWDLYGNSIRRNQLLNTVVQTLSDISSVSTSVISEVRTLLLQLALDNNYLVKQVAALAIAQWYQDSLYQTGTKAIQAKQRFFGTLQYFWTIAIDKDKISEQDSEAELWRDEIGATVTVAVSFAGEYAVSNNLPVELLDWLEEFSEHSNRTVSHYFDYHTLQFLVPLHLNQLEKLLKKWVLKHHRLKHPIAKAFARAYKEQPLEVHQILESWHKEGKDKVSNPITVTEVTQYNHLLTTVALAYGEIEYGK